MKFSELLKRDREYYGKKRFDGVQLSNTLGISRQSLHQWKKEELANRTGYELRAMAKVFGWDIRDLL